jgi:hypothetical protein
MSNHLDQQNCIYKGKSKTGAITKFIQTGKIAKKLDQDSLTSTIARFFIKCNIPLHTIDHPDFRELLRLCNPATKSLVCGKDTLTSFIQKVFQQGQQVL